MIKTAVMTCWSAPMKDGLRGGNALWSLSALCARQHFDKLILFADERGEQWLCNGLGLPFDSVERLDIDDAFVNLWALGKIVAYRTMAQRGAPFVHIDGDVCLLEPLPDRILNAGLLAEAEELWTPPPVIPRTLSLPRQWRRGGSRMWNCGVFGGWDTASIRTWSSEVLRVVRDNETRWSEVDGTNASMMVEQWSLGFLILREIETLFPAEPSNAGYVHLKEGKFSPAWRGRVERELIARFPLQAKRIGLQQAA